MSTDKFYIVEEILNRSGYVTPPKELLFGKWNRKYGCLRFEGMTIHDMCIDSYIRDTINHNLSDDILDSDNALEINERTYDIVKKWTHDFVKEILEWIDLIPEIKSHSEAVAILTDNNICISPHGREISTGENVIHSMAEEIIWQVDVNYSYQYIPFPSVCFSCDTFNLNHYWDLMNEGQTKFISLEGCKLLSCAIKNRFDKLVQSIIYIYKYKSLY